MSPFANQGYFSKRWTLPPRPSLAVEGVPGLPSLSHICCQATGLSGAGGKKMYSRDNIERKKLAPLLHLWKHLLSGDCSRRSRRRKGSCMPASGSRSCYHDGPVPGRDVPDYLAPRQLSGFPLRLPACKQREFFSINTAVRLCPQFSCRALNPLGWLGFAPHPFPATSPLPSPR